jgi:hypothetical protein
MSNVSHPGYRDSPFAGETSTLTPIERSSAVTGQTLGGSQARVDVMTARGVT